MREREREREREVITCKKWNNILNSTRLYLSSYGNHWERICGQILSLTPFCFHFREEQCLTFIYLIVDGSLVGNDFSFLHPQRLSASRDLKLSMLLGRHSRYLQLLRSNKVRAVKHSIDEDSTFLIAVPRKLSSDRLFIIPVNFGNELSFEQPERQRTVRDCILADMLGRSVRE